MTTHELKIWPQFFEAVKDGRKTFEYRNNDRAFQCGDLVILNEWDPRTLPSPYPDKMPVTGYTGRKLCFKIGYVLPVSETHVIFSLLHINESGEHGTK